LRRNQARAFELDRHPIAEDRMNTVAIIDFLDELLDEISGFAQVAVFLPRNLDDQKLDIPDILSHASQDHLASKLELRKVPIEILEVEHLETSSLN
jgi:hypothetical protein